MDPENLWNSYYRPLRRTSLVAGPACPLFSGPKEVSASNSGAHRCSRAVQTTDKPHRHEIFFVACGAPILTSTDLQSSPDTSHTCHPIPPMSAFLASGSCTSPSSSAPSASSSSSSWATGRSNKKNESKKHEFEDRTNFDRPFLAEVS